MTRQAVCLRCDWEGQTRSDTCPNCGVRLYRRVERAGLSTPWLARIRQRIARRSAPPAAGDLARGPLVPAHGTPAAAGPMEEVRSGRRRGSAAVVAAVVIVTGLAVWFVQQHTPAPPHERTGEVGSIIYTARAADGQTRLYRWDLFADTVSRGPLVHDPLALFDAEAAHPGWVGITSRSPAGGVDIGVFKFLGPDDQPLPLGRGDVSAWAPHGGDAVVGSLQPSIDGCSVLSVFAIHLSPSSERQAAGERICAQLDAVQLSQGVIYLSLRGSSGSRIAFLSVSRLRPLLNHYRLDSLSPASDMVVTPDAVGSQSSPGAALFFRGPSSQRPIPYVFGGSPFVLDRVLAWDPDATEALALGSVGGRSGFYRLQAAPPLSDTLPQTQPATYIAPAQGHAEALYTGVGTRLVFSGGRFSRVFDDSTSPFPMPPGAPVPTGPMAWVGP
ncbi:MAG: hypothetical protein QOI60_1615 [Actinomycetota bacterium]|nr:hypothetical protein [Actinomycetota bacterium]